jgi:hypothetical protein
MPGPNSQPNKFIGDRRVSGKTAVDRATGKSARHQQNRARKADINRSGNRGKAK